jgi:hypothetical protein
MAHISAIQNGTSPSHSKLSQILSKSRSLNHRDRWRLLPAAPCSSPSTSPSTLEAITGKFDASQTHLHNVVYLWHKCQIHQVEVELCKKVRPWHQPSLTDNLPFGFELFQIRWSSSSFTMSKSFGWTKVSRLKTKASILSEEDPLEPPQTENV